MRQRIVNAAARPEFWLAALLLWLLLSAARSLGTPWARAALTEALRWGAGIGLALVLGRGRPAPDTLARIAAAVTAVRAGLGVTGGFAPGHGGLVGPYHDHQLE